MSRFIPIKTRDKATDASVVSVLDLQKGHSHVYSSQDPLYKEIVEACQAQDEKTLENLLYRNPETSPAIDNNNAFKCEEDPFGYRLLTIDGKSIEGALKIILDRVKGEASTVATYVQFVRRLRKNPSSKAQERLFDCLKVNNHPLLPDGRFLAWKNVRQDWKDIHSGTMDNSPGTTVKMGRNEVDDDDRTTCSHGLHVASFEYANQFGGQSERRLLACAVDPKDVVSIPFDYNNQKMRVCEYEVLGEVERAPIDLATLEKIVMKDGSALKLVQDSVDPSLIRNPGARAETWPEDQDDDYDDEEEEEDCDDDDDDATFMVYKGLV